ncbi:high-affinity branched-chain amino acid ABC transporter substrate-binding protein (plasmid) [Rhizobium etli bv. mimosae str. Mim1]|nr:high-affinity branched-chain amino acid ABC transporter substrate-binding protein [Rhizobium etli bv. mimosae str. Mim1]
MPSLSRRATLTLGMMAAMMLATTASAADAIKIGFPANITGIEASFDGPMLNGAKLAVSEINAAGGVLGRPIDLVTYDTKSDTATISTVTSQMIESDKVKAFIGFADPDSVLAAAPQIEAAKIPLITPGATSPKLPLQVGTQVFLACFGDNVQAAVGAEFALKKLNAKKGYLITDMGMEYTTLLAEYFTKAYENGGGKLLGTDTYKTGDKNFTAQVTKIKALGEKPDFIFISAGGDEIGLILKQLRQAGVDIPVVGGDGYDTPLLLEMGGPAANNTYFTTHSFIGDGASPKVAAFMKAYKDAYGRAPENTFAALGYDAMKLMADAIKRAGSDDSAKIHEAIKTTAGLEGITGTITYKDGNPVPEKSVTVIGVKDGKLYLASEEAPSFVPAP